MGAINKDGTPHKSGWKFKQSAEAVEKIKAARTKQVHPGLEKHGVTREELDFAAAAGLRWCAGYCKTFVPREEFSNPDGRESRCKKCGARRQRERRAQWTAERQREEKRKHSDYIDANPSMYRKHHLSRYGVTQEWYDKKLREQGGGCGICGGPPVGKGGKNNYFSVDHDHDKSKKDGARGLLCAPCNIALHRVEAMADWGNRALAYLEKYKAA